VKAALRLVLLGVVAAAGCGRATVVDTSAAEEAVVTEVSGLIEAQVAAWNQGDLEGFTALYDEACTFLSPTGLTEGRAGVLERYRTRYPDRAAMGELAIELIELRPATLTVESLLGVRPLEPGLARPAGRLRAHADHLPAHPPGVADRPGRLDVIRRRNSRPGRS
jgi:hypothetical protein